MSGMHIEWRVIRLDDGDDEDLQLFDCLLKIEGRITCGNRPAGLVEAHYISTEDAESDCAFIDLWDLDGTTCAVYEEIINHKTGMFHFPIPWHMEFATGMLCVHFIGLRPEFRGIGMGRAVMGEMVRSWADPRTGVVLLDARPLQHRPRGYDDFGEEVRALPWNSPEMDHQRLIRHFESWRMEPVEKTRFMAAPPDFLCDSRAETWPPPYTKDRIDD